MPSLLVSLFRLCLGAWVGVGTFFVFVLLALRRSDLFDAATKLNHAKVLFPLYYPSLFTLLGAALLTGILASLPGKQRPLAPAGQNLAPRSSNRSIRWAVGLVAAILVLSIADWFWVYVPLVAMLDEQVLPPAFSAYHRASMWVNTVNLLLSLSAALLANWPRRCAE